MPSRSKRGTAQLSLRFRRPINRRGLVPAFPVTTTVCRSPGGIFPGGRSILQQGRKCSRRFLCGVDPCGAAHGPDGSGGFLSVPVSAFRSWVYRSSHIPPVTSTYTPLMMQQCDRRQRSRGFGMASVVWPKASVVVCHILTTASGSLSRQVYPGLLSMEVTELVRRRGRWNVSGFLEQFSLYRQRPDTGK